MEFVCGADNPLWDGSLTWEPEADASPQLTRCLRRTLLVWVPVGLLTLLALPRACMHANRRNSKKYDAVGSTSSCGRSLFAVKLLLYATVFVVATSEVIANYVNVGTQLPPSEWLYWASLCLSVGVGVFIAWSGGGWASAQPSGSLFLFWLAMLVVHLPGLHAAISGYDAPVISEVGAAAQILLPILFASLALTECFNGAGLWSASEDGSSLLSAATIGWMTSLVRIGFGRKITREDFPTASHRVQLGNIMERFNRHFDKAGQKVHVLRSLCRTFAPDLLSVAFFRICFDLISFAVPQILRRLIRVLDEGDQLWKGYFFAAVLSATFICKVLIFHWYTRKGYVMGLQMRAAVTSVVYDKALRISARASSKFTTGTITNLMSTDAQKFQEAMMNINVLWSGPFQLALAAYFLHDLVGWEAALAGLSMLFLCIPVNMVSGRLIRLLQSRQVGHKDERVKLLSEIIQGIKAIKFSAWEDAFTDRLNKIRGKEIDCFKGSAKVWAAMHTVFILCPSLVTIATFTTYVYVDPVNHVLTAEKAFACIAIIAILRVPMFMFPYFVVEAVRLAVSIKRINEFLNCEDTRLDGDVGRKMADDSSMVEFKEANLTWKSAEDTCLRKINLNVQKGELVAVIGEVGAGKSSLLSALLGEMTLASGKLAIASKKVAYVPQHAWIQNLTLKDNILFGQEVLEEDYQSVLERCALKEDLELLPGGDMTEIGENGINLSGGQKQRISLARACYSGADLFLLDDPLSAVDAHVAEHLFNNVIGPKGAMAKKTRVLATHNLTYLSKVDKIVLLKEGSISAIGSFDKLMEESNDFKEYVKTASMQEKEDHDEEKDEKEKVVEVIEKKDNGKSRITADEETSEARVSMRHLLYYFKMMNCSVVFVLLAMLAFCQTLNTLGIYILSQWAEDGGGAEGASEKGHTYYVSLFAGLAALQVIFDYLREYLANYRFAVAAERIHESSLHGVLASPMSFFDSNPIGRIMNRFSQDLATIDMLLPRQLNACMLILAMWLWSLIVVMFFIPVMIVGIAVILVLTGIMQVSFARTKRQLKRHEANLRSPLFAHISETVQGTQVIRAFGSQNRFVSENGEHLNSYLNCRYILDMSSKWFGIRVELLGSLVMILTSITTVYFAGAMGAGIVALVLTNTLTALEFIGMGVNTITEIESDSISLERMREYAHLPPEEEQHHQEVSNKLVLIDAEKDAKDDQEWPRKGDIVFSNYSTRYRPELDDVLKEIDLAIDNGEKLGICGRTGAGKSSLTMALLRIIKATSGSISLDNHDIAGVELKKLRTAITIIPQDPVMFSGTIRANIDPTERLTDDEVWHAVDMSQLKEWIGNLEGGLDHAVNEGGRNLSAGQRQLICLARALARKEQTRVLLLDEATSAVDHETDLKIQQAITKGFPDCTILTVAHRLGTITNSDRILVMSKGKVAELAPPKKLMEDETSAFYKMCKDAGLNNII